VHLASLFRFFTESHKDQKTKRFSNLVFDLQCLICGTCAPHQKSQIPIYHAYILCPLSLCLYDYFKYFLSLIPLALFISIRVREGRRRGEGGEKEGRRRGEEGGGGEGRARGPY
jgi:hypothetical protein